MSQQVTVLYIGGAGRSGSTVLGQMLGQMPGYVNVGELWQIWDRGLQQNELCGCGQPFRSCAFWDTVGAKAFGGWGNVDVNRMAAFKPFLRRLRYAPHFALGTMSGTYSRRMVELLREGGPVLERLYGAIKKVSGASVIVDSSKRSSYATLLGELPSVDLRIVHLVRDSRAVAYSWARNRTRTEIVDRDVQMPRLSAASACRAWSISNYRYHLFTVSPRFSRLRYEDLMDDAALHIGGSLTRLGIDFEVDDLRFLKERNIALDVDHTVSGNPSRFRNGSIELRPDEEWKDKMGSKDKSLVTLLTAPLLLRYGYLGKRKTDA